VNPEPVSRPTRIADVRVSPPVLVPATLIRNFPQSQLAAIESVWAPARRALAEARARAGTPLESGHWNWNNKVDRVTQGQLILHAIECEGEIQGLMAIGAQPRSAHLTIDSSVVYIDYLEAAPWNQRAPEYQSRFGGVGSALFNEAVILSTELGLSGRIGLHSLPRKRKDSTQPVRWHDLGVIRPILNWCISSMMMQEQLAGLRRGTPDEYSKPTIT
jgi:hypothetical protein